MTEKEKKMSQNSTLKTTFNLKSNAAKILKLGKTYVKDAKPGTCVTVEYVGRKSNQTGRRKRR